MENKNKNINEKELEVLKFWNENKIFEKSLLNTKREKGDNNFTFYDGPPFATGTPHHGHLLAGTIKDVIPRFQTMNGKYVRRMWGWDCHGLPIENLIEKKFNLNSKKDIEDFGIGKFNKAAEESVLTYEKEWKETVPRFGRWVDMDNPYKTMDYTYTESVWWAFNELNKKGLVFEGHKSMHICPRCETTLAQSEVALGYKDLTDISVTAKFELLDEPNTFILAWTTTPWTLPGNVALAINSEVEYIKVRMENGENLILAKERLADVLKENKYEIVEEFLGKELVGKKYKPVFDFYLNTNLENKENLYTIVDALFVTLDTGTGIVHIAPAFGEDDLVLGKEKSLPIIKHVEPDGTFSKELGEFAGIKVKTATDNQSADIAILKNLAERNLIFSKEKLVHSYPTCWRCDTPLLNYATSSWFIDVPKIKENLIEANSKINWLPENIRDGRFGKWLEGAREWAVSRSRYWGAPLPIWKEIDGEEVKIIGSLKELAENNLAKPKNEYYFMRHGEAKHNVNGVEESLRDPENTLTENGILQVEESKKNNDVEFDVIISSPYLRTRMTAEIMAGDKKDEIIIDENFREIELGSYGNARKEIIRAKYGEGFLKMKTKLNGDDESYGEVMQRVMRGLAKLEKEYEGKKILIVSHGAPIRMAIAVGQLLTEEEIVYDDKNGSEIYPNTAEIKKLEWKIVPRDETGEINLHRPYIDEVVLKSSNGKEMKRVEYVFDCWFESGSMPFGQFHYPFENRELFERSFPADFIAEGLDQTRGWFYSLLNLSIGIFGKASYKNVIVNGLLLAADGEKMSKSKNNYTDPNILVEKYGADAFRYSLLSSPVICAENTPFLDSGVEENYKKIVAKLENVLSFYEMTKDENLTTTFSENLDEEKIKKNIKESSLDSWIFARFNSVLENTTKNVNEYRLDLAARPFEKFIDDLSTWWLRRSRERLKGEGEEKEVSMFTLWKILTEFSKVIAPFMPFLAERVYQSLSLENEKQKESVHLETWPEVFIDIDSEVLGEMEEVRELVTELLMIRQKNNIPVRQPLATAYINKDIKEKYINIIAEELNVKKIEKGDENSLDLVLTEELKKEGEYREFSRKVKDLRKENNLTPNDIAILFVKANKERIELIKSFEEEIKKECKLSEIKFEEGGEEEISLKK
ncbi:Isoleucine--tRNA ligase [bioreactor metagenome]|uniref:isoleucine--tRNA ligase n=1 Tax=bioreactor metagenome TaxID=1076179 RepID=A0A644UAH6_9ZZZZ|nr:class I tRNA ligase family protein [Candidatus Elulimicrobiales bacterium]